MWQCLSLKSFANHINSKTLINGGFLVTKMYFCSHFLGLNLSSYYIDLCLFPYDLVVVFFINFLDLYVGLSFIFRQLYYAYYLYAFLTETERKFNKIGQFNTKVSLHTSYVKLITYLPQ